MRSQPEELLQNASKLPSLAFQFITTVKYTKRYVQKC